MPLELDELTRDVFCAHGPWSVALHQRCRKSAAKSWCAIRLILRGDREPFETVEDCSARIRSSLPGTAVSGRCEQIRRVAAYVLAEHALELSVSRPQAGGHL